MKEEQTWRWSEDFRCWVYPDKFMTQPHLFCLGERMLYWQPGLDTWYSNLRGSTTTHWGGWSFKYDLKQGIDWLREAKEKGNDNWTTAGQLVVKDNSGIDVYQLLADKLGLRETKCNIWSDGRMYYTLTQFGFQRIRSDR